MATVEQCEQALQVLATRLASNPTARERADYDRSLSCTIRDLDVVFSGRLAHGELKDITRVGAGESHPEAQVRIEVAGDDLLHLVDGSLAVGHAIATGRLRVSAGVRDLIRLRAAF